MEPINWLWPDRIACGKLTVLAGNPGLGKSQLSAAIAAMVSTGGAWPNGEGWAPTGSIIMLSAEDDVADTIKPRLLAAGANVSRCHILDAVKTESSSDKPNVSDKVTHRGFDLSQDVKRLEQAVISLKDVRAVIIDPVSAYLGKIDSNNNSEIRALLTPLSEMAGRTGVAVLLVTHMNKSTTQEMIARVIGSIGLVAAARGGYAIVKCEKNPDVRYFLPLKNNIGNDKDGFGFHIEGVELPEGISTSKISWQAGLINAHDILDPKPKETAVNGAQDFLREFMENGPRLATEIFEAAAGNGYSNQSMQRAKKRLGLKTRKLGMDGSWEWYNPNRSGMPQAEDDEEYEDAY